MKASNLTSLREKWEDNEEPGQEHEVEMQSAQRKDEQLQLGMSVWEMRPGMSVRGTLTLDVTATNSISVNYRLKASDDLFEKSVQVVDSSEHFFHLCTLDCSILK